MSTPSPRGGARSAWANRRARRVDVLSDLLHQRLLARKHRLLAEVGPQLDDEPLPVQVAFEVEQERLDPPFGAAVVRVYADRHGGAMPARGARVDPEARHEQVGIDVEVRRRVAELSAARV